MKFNGCDMTGNPLLHLSVMLEMMGVQFISMGLLGEMLRAGDTVVFVRGPNVPAAAEPVLVTRNVLVQAVKSAGVTLMFWIQIGRASCRERVYSPV